MLHGDELLQLLQAVDILDLIDKLHTGRERERKKSSATPVAPKNTSGGVTGSIREMQDKWQLRLGHPWLRVSLKSNLRD